MRCNRHTFTQVISTIALVGVLGFALITPVAARGETPPRVVTREQYMCLLKYRGELAVSKRGTVIDLSECPPKPVLGAFPQRASERYILLTPADVACLRKIRPGDTKIAKNLGEDKVEMYLRPCGVN